MTKNQSRYELLIAIMLTSVFALSITACGGSSAPSDSGTIVCTTADDCPLGLSCINGVCSANQAECTFDSDCAQDEHCVNGTCEQVQSDGGTDGGADGGADAGDQNQGKPVIEADPVEIDFGNGHIGDTVTQQLTVRNTGDGDLEVFSISFESGSSPEFSAEPLGELNQTLSPSDELLVSVSYRPTDASVDQGALLIVSNDPEHSLLRVKLSSSYKGSSEISVVNDVHGDLSEVELLDFGRIQLGSTSSISVYVLNTGTGNAVLTIDEVRTQPITSEFFQLQADPTPPAYLPPFPGPCTTDSDCGEANTCTNGLCVDGNGSHIDAQVIQLTFSATQVGTFQESLVITNDETDGDGDENIRIITLRGQGVQPSLEVTPKPIEFGQLYTGQSSEQTITLANTGGQVLVISSIALVDGQGPFSISPGDQSPWRLEPGEQIQFTATYAPQSPGAHSDVLQIISDDPSSPTLVDLRGTALSPPVMAINPSSLDFGEVQLGQSLQMSVQIHNEGGSTLSINSISLASDGSEFSLLQEAIPDIAPGEQRTLDIRYSPVGAIGADSDMIIISTNDPESPEVLVNLSGIGTDPVLELSPDSIDFGPIYQGYTAGPQILVVRNAGFGSLMVQSIALAIGSNPDYTLGTLPAMPLVLTSGQNISVEVYFTPSGSGSRTAAIEISSSDADQAGTSSIPVTGSGSDCPAGHWDADGIPSNGCEYECDLSNGGVEDCDGIDNDCDNHIDEDLTTRQCQIGNNFGTCYGTETCDGQNGWVGCDAATPEQETCDGQDNDCDDAVDAQDNDLRLDPCELQQGVCIGATHRASQCVSGHWQGCQAADYGGGYGLEVCDNMDNDCDGNTDVDDPDLVIVNCENQNGVCAGSTKPLALCQGTWLQCNQSEYADHSADYGEETCDGKDNDCDGFTDSADNDLIGTLCENQHGQCAGAIHRTSLCTNGTWNPCEDTDYQVDPDYGPEVCDGLDNNCQGGVDEGLSTRQCEIGNTYGTCYGTETCDGQNGWVGCDASTPAEEVCDGVDNDCNGATDGDDPGLLIPLCELQDGVCAGSTHSPAECNGTDWELCDNSDYEANDSNFGVEICGNALDEDCSGFANDKDSDADGHMDSACGGDDCNDDNPNTYTGATEVQDADDNDCDGLVDEGLIPVGAAIVTEIMQNPDAVGDSAGEYFEVTNDWTAPINLDSWVIYDKGADSFNVNKPSGIVIDPGESAVFCANADSAINGGISCDYDFDNFALANADDEIVLSLDGVIIDEVDYDGGPSFPDPTGSSMNLDPAKYDHLDNDDGSNWCSTPPDASNELPAGDHGTPGLLNPSCTGDLAILDVQPGSGITQGGETITVYGAGFSGIVSVSIGSGACTGINVLSDIELTCTTPANSVGDYDVQVDDGTYTDTLVDAYRYVDSAGSLTWCNIQYPTSVDTSVGVLTPLIFGQVYEPGITEAAGPPAGITAQLGIGPAGTNPGTTPGWTWYEATWNPSCASCGNNDEFMQQVSVDAAGTYSYAYRFADDGGYHYLYCDLDGSSPSDPVEPGKLGILTVN